LKSGEDSILARATAIIDMVIKHIKTVIGESFARRDGLKVWTVPISLVLFVAKLQNTCFSNTRAKKAM